ncbi:MAG: ferritin family protein [Thermodesulfobacteriota bacterium]
MAGRKSRARDSQLEAIKGAIMLEIHGLRFYQVAADRCTNRVAKELFQDLAQDELSHRAELERQFRHVLEKEKAAPMPSAEAKDLRFKDPVIGADLKELVGDAWFDSAALSIGVMLEKKAMNYYRRRQRSVRDPQLEALFEWLSNWEKSHLNRLMALERAMREEIWNQARFWPLD